MTDSEIALLGLLAEKPRYGYELDKTIETRGMREWTDIAFSSIYAVLRSLDQKGMVSASTEVAGNRVRKLFSITKEGKKALKDALIGLIADPEPPKDPMMLALAYINAMPADDTARAFTARLKLLEETKTRLTAKMNENTKSPANVRLMFERSLAGVEAEMEFAKTMAGGTAEEMEEMEETDETEVKPEPKPEQITEIMPEVKPETITKQVSDEVKDTLF